MQKLDFNKDGKLVAYTDNGCTDGKSATTDIDGTFEVSADVVKFILAKEYDLAAEIALSWRTISEFEKRYSVIYCTLNRGRDQSCQILSLEQQLNDLNYKMSIQKEEYKKLLDAIDEFNKSRYFFERKFKF